jgi:hypothetical protein
LRVYLNAWFARFARKEGIAADALWDAVDRVEQGLIDADLGGGVIKQRIARVGGGKAKDYRSIVLYCKADRAFFVFGFPKSMQGNIGADEALQFKKMAKHVLALADEPLQRLIDSGQFEELVKDV